MFRNCILSYRGLSDAKIHANPTSATWTAPDTTTDKKKERYASSMKIRQRAPHVFMFLTLHVIGRDMARMQVRRKRSSLYPCYKRDDPLERTQTDLHVTKVSLSMVILRQD